ncbi:MAG: TraR/DksA C4-type zinc finger protein [Pseudomonadota bacterium]|nr:TraR/DksA C4-type zinc finger protein [Pseudomonadota bacterium]
MDGRIAFARIKTIKSITTKALGLQGLLEAQQIKEALRRNKDGTFVYCIQCDEEIAEKMLELLPRAPLCKACISDTESRRSPEKLNPSHRDTQYLDLSEKIESAWPVLLWWAL